MLERDACGEEILYFVDCSTMVTKRLMIEGLVLNLLNLTGVTVK